MYDKRHAWERDMNRAEILAKIAELEEELESLDEMDYQSFEVINYELQFLYIDLDRAE